MNFLRGVLTVRLRERDGLIVNLGQESRRQSAGEGGGDRKLDGLRSIQGRGGEERRVDVPQPTGLD